MTQNESMKILFYSVKAFERPYLANAGDQQFAISMTATALTAETAHLAAGFNTISVFTGDDVSAGVIKKLQATGVKFIAVRAAGYDNVDLEVAAKAGIRVANVPEYSPYAIAEHALALILALNRKLIKADRNVHQQNFKVDELVGFDLHGKTIGIIGTGKIGAIFAKIMHGLGCHLLAYDINQNKELTDNNEVEYVPLDKLCRESDIISIHTGLTPQTRYMIDHRLIELMKSGVMLINTGRGACINTYDVIHFLETGHIRYFGADVYEKERGVFFYDHQGEDLHDETLKKLLSFPNVLITPHQAFATNEALNNITQTTFENIGCWARGKGSKHELALPGKVSAAIHQTVQV
jgi:D-lactate dehydrogenase